MNQKRIDQLNKITRSDPEDFEDNPDKLKLIKRIGVTALVLLAVTGAIYVERVDARGPQFSSTTKEYKVEEHDTVWGAAKTVDGIDAVDTRRVVDYIEDMPENQETLSDGLQPNETIIVPESVER